MTKGVFMIFEFTYDNDKLANQVCFNLENVQMGLYQKIGFQVLPYLPYGFRQSSFVPDFDYTDEFWKAMSSAHPTNYGATFPTLAREFIKKELKSYKQNFKIDIKEKEKEWIQMSHDFICDLELIFGKGSFDIFEKVEILQTPFGTPGSFSPIKLANGKYFLPICLRYDMPVAYVGNMLISNFYIVKAPYSTETGEIGFYERMATVRFLREQSILYKYFPKEKTTIANEFKKYINDSEKFLKKLGFSSYNGCSLSENDDLIVHGKIVNEYFTKQERRIIIKLIKNANHIISYDMFAEILWENNADEKYSLYSIAKVVENVRRKLRELGLKKTRIKTIRGEGYVWVE